MSVLLGAAKILFVVVTVLMIGAILLQEGKGGGLAALGGTRAEAAFGASNPIRRLTVVLAVIFFLLCGFITYQEIPARIAGPEPTEETDPQQPAPAPGAGAETPAEPEGKTATPEKAQPEAGTETAPKAKGEDAETKEPESKPAAPEAQDP